MLGVRNKSPVIQHQIMYASGDDVSDHRRNGFIDPTEFDQADQDPIVKKRRRTSGYKIFRKAASVRGPCFRNIQDPAPPGCSLPASFVPTRSAFAITVNV